MVLGNSVSCFRLPFAYCFSANNEISTAQLYQR